MTVKLRVSRVCIKILRDAFTSWPASMVLVIIIEDINIWEFLLKIMHNHAGCIIIIVSQDT